MSEAREVRQWYNPATDQWENNPAGLITPEPRFVLHGHLVGGHYRCRLFAGAGFGKRGNTGAVVMDENDWKAWGDLARIVPQLVGRVEEPPTWPDVTAVWACAECMAGNCSACTSDGPEGYCYCSHEDHPPPENVHDLGVL